MDEIRIRFIFFTQLEGFHGSARVKRYLYLSVCFYHVDGVGVERSAHLIEIHVGYLYGFDVVEFLVHGNNVLDVLHAHGQGLNGKVGRLFEIKNVRFRDGHCDHVLVLDRFEKLFVDVMSQTDVDRFGVLKHVFFEILGGKKYRYEKVLSRQLLEKHSLVVDREVGRSNVLKDYFEQRFKFSSIFRHGSEHVVVAYYNSLENRIN
jgi:hypothetical protein